MCKVGLVLGRVDLLWVVWRGQLGPWQGVHLQARIWFRALVILGDVAPVQRDLPFAVCCPECSPSQAGHQEGYRGAPSRDKHGSGGGGHRDSTC